MTQNTTVSFDITTADDAQLAILEKLAPEAVANERQRRQSFETASEAVNHVTQVGADLTARFAALKNSPAAKELKASGILEAITRLTNFARLGGFGDGVQFVEPTVPVYEKPALKETKEGEAPATEGSTEGQGEADAAEGKKGGRGKKADADQPVAE